MSNLIFARSPYTIKHTSVADPPPPPYECFETNDYGRYADIAGYSVNAAGAIQNGTITDKITGNTLTQTAFLKPKCKNNKLKNLYYIGQLTVPGPGVPPAIVSGKIVANLISLNH